MEKQITVTELANELRKRVADAKDIECCKKEILNLAKLASEKIGQEKVTVEWKDN